MLVEAMLCLVVGIADGDTLTVRCGSPGAYEQLRVRINAIDAPERSQDFGSVSRTSLSDLCFKKNAKVIPDGNRSYDRIVATVECEGTDVATHQVRTGLAWVETRYAAKRQDLFPLEKAARQQRIGLWSLPNPVKPSEFRHQSKN